MRLDANGKVSLDHVYNQPDPRPYFRAFHPLGYAIPQHAKPYFAKLVREYRDARGVAVPQVLDIGCSYGINAALLKYDMTLDELYTRYCPRNPDTRTREALLAQDRELAARPAGPAVRVVGLDASAEALAYAHEAGFLDDAVRADLERDELTLPQRDALAGTDLIVSTGALGYVSERTLVRVLRAQGERRPWMAHFMLRMFPFDPIDAALADLGYETTRVDGFFRQRRFASPEEQARLLEGMAAAGVDPSGLEAEGWMYAHLYLSRPTASRSDHVNREPR
ncbi:MULTISPECIES: class I SAM-dependent methyltransferase [unclassified Streptomyces]|uniref:class I SAM-dependent methyltransferase n=1 Tax=unclassified Streptomyces TaxID=2593676 RepID=UPI0022B70582|nr:MULTISPECIES: class I SAM-dependent methyltransferase [unclassified Streptomyces]MCZ7413928.1 class I SAM-dependent methyltransferase [Streptomyces sp. WMMC897]MCZ7430924.1 class I SAM-dependent methyltransferase [Streptomyces sp. WMMC1477]